MIKTIFGSLSKIFIKYNELRLSLRKDHFYLLSYKFEDFIIDFCDLYNVALLIAEVKLKQTIAKRLLDLSEA